MSSHGRILTRTVLGVATALVATLGIAAPASAAAVSSEPQSCWLNADTGEYACFSSDDALDAALSARGIEIVDSSSQLHSARSAAREMTATASTTSAAYIYARLYADSNYKGAALTVTGTNSGGCAAGGSSTSNMPSDWNDRVSSFRGYLGCRVRLAEHINQGGKLYGPFSASSALGSFNDKASSYRVAK